MNSDTWGRMLLLLLACTHGDDTGKIDDTGDTADTGSAVDRLTILHTNDLHSHLAGWGPNAEYSPGTTGDDATIGGMARIKAMADAIRAGSDHPVVMFDAGDWMFGDVFQLLATSDAAELQTMQSMGYDAITLGNHEFDLGPDVLGQVIDVADANGVTLPILSGNVVPNAGDPGDDALEAHYTSGRIQPTMVLDVAGLKIGLFGLIGDEAQRITPGITPSSFTPATDSAAAAVASLQAENLDILVGITHNGVTDDPETSPDEQLARDVPGIDVIVGGHSHTALMEYRTAGDNNTIIVQAGSYTQYLGQLDLVRGDSGWTVESYALHLVDDSVLGDSAVNAQVEDFYDVLDAGPLAALGYTHDQPIAHIPADIVMVECSESSLGNLITDAFLAQTNASGPAAPIDFAFESQGVIRDSLLAGSSGIEAFSDFFRVLPLGMGVDAVPGYDLVDFWVTGRDVQNACEVTSSIAPTYGCNYFVEVAGMRCTYDMTRPQFNRAIRVERQTEGGWEEIDTSNGATTLYHITVDSYVASLMSILEDLTFGAIVITPKDADGIPYASVDEMRFDRDPDTAGVQTMKLWQALVQYGASAPDTNGDGVPDLDSAYAAPAGRLIGL